MIKKLITLFLLCSPLFANEYLKITSNKKLEYHDHETYESWYDVEYKNPAFVIWNLTAKEAEDSDKETGNRSSSFKQCGSSATHKMYTVSKNETDKVRYDRGHMCPNNDRDWSKESAAETFRMCNVAPQRHSLNNGSWKKYEKYGHELAKNYKFVTIACGPIYDTINFVNDTDIRVPDRFFKIFVVEGKIIEAYIFDKNGGDPLYVSEKEIERVAKIKFEVK